MSGGVTWLEMLENVLKRRSGANEIVWKITTSYDDQSSLTWGYIDHQSSAVEGENTEIFESEETLERFLFGPQSRIELNNDNG